MFRHTNYESYFRPYLKPWKEVEQKEEKEWSESESVQDDFKNRILWSMILEPVEEEMDQGPLDSESENSKGKDTPEIDFSICLVIPYFLSREVSEGSNETAERNLTS